MTITFERFVRTPFQVVAAKITEENIDELAKLVGDVTIHPRTQEKYITLDRRIVPNIDRAYVGWWITKFGDHYRCYDARPFKKQFMPMPETQPVSFMFTDPELEEAPTVVESGAFGRVVEVDPIWPSELSSQ